jgi:hypothetical protein
LVVVSGSDGQGLLMEVPYLLSSSISSLDAHVSVIINFEVSVVWKLRDDVEVSFNIESELLVQFTLSWFSLPFISIDDIPLLVNLSILWSGFNISVFSIDISLDMNDLTFLIYNEGVFVSPHLPPS